MNWLGTNSKVSGFSRPDVAQGDKNATVNATGCGFKSHCATMASSGRDKYKIYVPIFMSGIVTLFI